ncbi:MAG: aryl-sulfate sulfotransferase, partial [Gemmatimonadota bacterium]
FELMLLKSGRPAVAVDTLSFTTGSLPDWIPAADALGNDTTAGLVVLSYPGGPVIVDNGGRVVWYKTAPDGLLNSFQAHANGAYTLLGATDVSRAYHVLDVLGREIGTLECVEFLIRFHDFLVLEGGDYWALCDEERVFDLTEFGGLSDAVVTGTVVQHISATGALLFEWKVLDHFDITDIPVSQLTGRQVNFSHGNGIDLTEDGDLILSFRSLNEITKVDTETGQVVWRFGGLRNQFTFVGDPKGSFQRQHGVRVAGPGIIQFLDNSETPPSRLVRFRLDEDALTATLIFAFADAPDILTPVGGSTQYYRSNGHGLVSFGRAGRVVETDASGNRAWELTGIDGLYVFRAQRIPSLYFPGAGGV